MKKGMSENVVRDRDSQRKHHFACQCRMVSKRRSGREIEEEGGEEVEARCNKNFGNI